MWFESLASTSVHYCFILRIFFSCFHAAWCFSFYSRADVFPTWILLSIRISHDKHKLGLYKCHQFLRKEKEDNTKILWKLCKWFIHVSVCEDFLKMNICLALNSLITITIRMYEYLLITNILSTQVIFFISLFIISYKFKMSNNFFKTKLIIDHG